MIVHIRRSRILLSLCGGLFCLGILLIWMNGGEEKEEDREKFPSFERIDQICVPRERKCFEVVDRKYRRGSEEVVTRSLELTLFTGSRFVESVVRIQPEYNNFTFSDSDTRLWSLNGEEIESDYGKGMVMMTYITKIMRTQRRREEKEIAMIGGGGGSIIAHLKTLKDGINYTVVEKRKEIVTLGKRWFEMGDNVVISDGLEWMKMKAEEDDSKFDVIFLDACERSSSQHCPDPIFMKDENIKYLHSLLTNGTRALVVINFEVYSAMKWEILLKQMDKLISIFPACLSLEMKNEVNMIVGCLTRPLPYYDKENARSSLDTSMAFVLDRFEEAINNELQYYGPVFKEIAVHALIDGKRETVQHPAEKQI